MLNELLTWNIPKFKSSLPLENGRITPRVVFTPMLNTTDLENHAPLHRHVPSHHGLPLHFYVPLNHHQPPQYHEPHHTVPIHHSPPLCHDVVPPLSRWNTPIIIIIIINTATNSNHRRPRLLENLFENYETARCSLVDSAISWQFHGIRSNFRLQNHDFWALSCHITY